MSVMVSLLAAGLLLAAGPAPAKAAPAAPAKSPAKAPSAAPASPRPRFEWNVPELESDVEVEGTLHAQGIPIRMHMAVSRMDALELYRHFGREFMKAGFYITPRNELPKNLPLHISAVDPERLLVYTVFFKLRADKKVTLYLATSDMQHRERPDAAFAPVYPGAGPVTVSNVEVAKTLIYTAAAKPEEVMAFYRETLGKAGFQETPEAGLFEKGNEQLRITTRPTQEGNGKVGVVILSRTSPQEGLASTAAAEPASR